ncbi:hypothetical protein [Gelidibacter salicanalis]|uniref:Uncharacterized protein n=1 Tax=Gelidibacter salicanalis TaxID=291193 RepID=A0A934KQB2_9FLAO|nr:hypothetical protein [Gelidibacter salicanalis]MBJ7881529.1 hypothetical protein [Gelidibacter salicanalis]
MKNIRIITSILCLTILWTCSNDEYQDYDAPDELSDILWLIGTNKNSQDQYSINAATHLSFLDLSQGAVSHEWIIEEGNNFLKEGFNSTDSLTAFIIPNAGLSTTKPKAHILFNNSGLNKVRLLNKFDKPVKYVSSQGILEAVQEGNLWVIDTTFTFDVYAQIKPAFKVYQDGVEILNITEADMPSVSDSDSWPTIEVEAGTALRFEDLTTVGRPNGRSWRFPEGTPNQIGGVTANVSFFQLGTFTGEMRSFRVSPLPTSTVTKLIPLKVKVIPSSQPFVFSGQIKESENEKILFQLNGEVVPFSGEEANFTVNVFNEQSGFNQVIPVQTASVSTDNATFIELTLSQPIYNSDTITVTYDASTNGITSTDTRVLQSFGPERVQMYFGNNILPGNSWASFEPSGGGINNAFASNQFFIPGGQGNGQFDDLIWERVTTKSFDGVASMRYKLPAGEKLPLINLFGFGLADGPGGVPAGTYRVSYRVYKENSNLQKFRMEFGNPTTDIKIFDISAIPNNQWVEVSETITFNEDLTADNYRTALRIVDEDNPGITGPQLLYFDDLALIKLEPRL